MTEKSEYFELESRYCPICGEKVQAGFPSHRCNNKKLAQLEKLDKIKEEQIEDYLDENREFDDKLEESETYYSNEGYYEIDQEEGV